MSKGSGAGALALACALALSGAVRAGEALRLDGETLDPLTLVAAARDGRRVEGAAEGWRRVRQGRALLIAAAERCQKIYGLTTGVGANKDRAALDCDALLDAEGGLTAATMAASRRFNAALLNAHGAGVAPFAAPEIARAAMIARLNGALRGGSGIDEPVARRLQTFLNRDILPLIPERGSLGQADITLLSHVGLAMQGRWRVAHRGVVRPAAEALRAEGLAPLAFSGKDALGSFSANAYAAAQAAFALDALRAAARMTRLVYAMSLEALDGNVAPLLAEPAKARPFPGVEAAAADLRALLADSYLFAPSEGRPLQDPLSFRTALYQLAALDEAAADLAATLRLQLNGSDDNPLVWIGPVDAATAGADGIAVMREDGLEGAVIPSGNFAGLPLALSLERAALAAAHAGEGVTRRTIALMNPDFTGLPRFLAGPDTTHAFGAIHKPIVALQAEIRDLAEPVSLDFAPVALGVEDMATNAPRAARRLRRIAENLTALLGFELMLSAQALDLRRADRPGLALAPTTLALHAAWRARAPFLARDDQIFTPLIAEAAAFVAACRPEGAEAEAWRAAAAAGRLCGGEPDIATEKDDRS